MRTTFVVTYALFLIAGAVSARHLTGDPCAGAVLYPNGNDFVCVSGNPAYGVCQVRYDGRFCWCETHFSGGKMQCRDGQMPVITSLVKAECKYGGVNPATGPNGVGAGCGVFAGGGCRAGLWCKDKAGGGCVWNMLNLFHCTCEM